MHRDCSAVYGGDNAWNIQPTRPLPPGLTRKNHAWQRAPGLIWLSRNWSRIVETRLIIAYSLIALIVAVAIYAGIALSKRKALARTRGYRKKGL